MRKILAMLAALTLIGGATIVGVRAQSASGPARATPQQAAQKLLQTRAAQYMTSPSQAAMHMLATGSRSFGQDKTPSGVKPVAPGNSSRQGTPPSAPGQGNVRVNDLGEDSHQPEQTTQSETSIAVSGNNVAVGFNDSQSTLLFLSPGTNLSGYAYSRNGGQTFVDGGVIPNAPGGTINFGDPWLASDSAGNMYYSTLADDPFAGLVVGVAKSTNGGQSWSTPTLISPPTPAIPNSFFLGADKDSLSSSSSGLSDTWDDFTATFDPNTGALTEYSGLTLARSTDGGQTWSSSYVSQIPIGTFDPNAPPDCSFHQYIGAQSITGPDGTLYVASLRLDATDPTCSGAPVTESEYIFASHDNGATFGAGVKIADVSSSTGPFGAFILGPAQYMRNLEFPTLAFRGSTLYVTWNDGGDGSGHSHIRLAQSSNGGATWTTSWVTSGSNDEAQPSISGDAAGIHISYYEISGAGSGSALLDVFTSSSSDGKTFTPTRVTNQSFPGDLTVPQFDPIIAPAYMGDYISNVSDGTHQYVAWGDNRDRVTDFLYPQGRSDPNVYFAKQ